MAVLPSRPDAMELTNIATAGPDAAYTDLLESAGIAFQRVDLAGKVLWANRPQLLLAGCAPDEYIGRAASDFYDIQGIQVPVRERKTTLRTADGRTRHVLLTISSQYSNGEPCFENWITADVSERRRSEIRLDLQFGVSQVLASCESLEEAAPAVLDLIGEHLDFDCGALWQPAASGDLICRFVWTRPGAAVEPFVEETLRLTLRKGVGLPGRVWAQAAPAWVEELLTDGDFQRRAAAMASGLHSGVAFAIRTGEQLLGVMEFFSSVARKPDVLLLDALDTVGLHVGQFIRRCEAEKASASRSRQLQVLYRMADAVIRADSVEEIYSQALQTIHDLIDVGRSSILLADSDGVMHFKIWRGLSEEFRRAMEGYPPWQHHTKSPEPILVADVANSPSNLASLPVFQRENIAAVAIVPLKVRGRLTGSVLLCFAEPRTLTESEVALVRAVAGHVAVAIERKDSESVVQEQQTRLQLALEADHTGVWEWDIPNDRIIWSDRVYEIHGMPPGSISGLAGEAIAYIHPDDRDRARDTIRGALADRGSYTMEIRILQPGGDVRWISTSGRVVCDETQQPVRLIGTTVDITERKQTEVALRESAETINALLESAAQGIIAVDEHGQIATVNATAEKMFGYSRGELFGRNVETLVPERFRAAHIRHRHRFTANPHIRSVGAGLHLTALRSDGSEFPVEISLRSIDTAAGRLSVSFIADVTDRYQSERETRESEERYRTLFEHSNDALGVSVDEKFSHVNSAFARMFGYESPDDLVGVSIFATLPPNQYENIRAQRIARQQAGSLDPMIYQGAGLRQDGSQFISEIRATDYWMNGKLHTLAILRDVTAERQAEDALAAQAEALARSNADLQQFAYATSHDLQEPLRNIRAFAELLARRYKGRLEGDADLFIGNIVSGCMRMEALVRDLLAFSRVTSSEQATFGSVDMSATLAWAEKNLETSIREAGCIVTHDGLPSVNGDQVRLVQLLQNLLSNAVKYRRETSPRIHVSATRRGGQWIFAVADNGAGIAPEYYERIFGLFKRLHGRDVPGTGVGLAICKKIVEKHGGQIWVESVKDTGSTFYFTLSA